MLCYFQETQALALKNMVKGISGHFSFEKLFIFALDDLRQDIAG